MTHNVYGINYFQVKCMTAAYVAESSQEVALALGHSLILNSSSDYDDGSR